MDSSWLTMLLLVMSVRVRSLTVLIVLMRTTAGLVKEDFSFLHYPPALPVLPAKMVVLTAKMLRPAIYVRQVMYFLMIPVHCVPPTS